MPRNKNSFFLALTQKGLILFYLRHRHEYRKNLLYLSDVPMTTTCLCEQNNFDMSSANIRNIKIDVFRTLHRNIIL